MDQEFDSMSYFLLKRTKDMVNKYRQLLVKETQVERSLRIQMFVTFISSGLVWRDVVLFPQQESPSAEMVMLERLFLQAERFSLAEDRRRARRDPGQQPNRAPSY